MGGNKGERRDEKMEKIIRKYMKMEESGSNKDDLIEERSEEKKVVD